MASPPVPNYVWVHIISSCLVWDIPSLASTSRLFNSIVRRPAVLDTMKLSSVNNVHEKRGSEPPASWVSRWNIYYRKQKIHALTRALETDDDVVFRNAVVDIEDLGLYISDADIELGLTYLHRLCIRPSVNCLLYLFKDSDLSIERLLEDFFSSRSRDHVYLESKGLSGKTPIEIIIEGKSQEAKNIVHAFRSWIHANRVLQGLVWTQIHHNRTSLPDVRCLISELKLDLDCPLVFRDSRKMLFRNMGIVDVTIATYIEKSSAFLSQLLSSTSRPIKEDSIRTLWLNYKNGWTVKGIVKTIRVLLSHGAKLQFPDEMSGHWRALHAFIIPKYSKLVSLFKTANSKGIPNHLEVDEFTQLRVFMDWLVINGATSKKHAENNQPHPVSLMQDCLVGRSFYGSGGTCVKFRADKTMKFDDMEATWTQTGPYVNCVSADTAKQFMLQRVANRVYCIQVPVGSTSIEAIDDAFCGEHAMQNFGALLGGVSEFNILPKL